MKQVAQAIFKAIHEGKWLSITYKNKQGEHTRYWIAVKDIDRKRRSLKVEGFHLTEHTLSDFDCIYLDSILSAAVIEGSYCEPNQKLISRMQAQPEQYEDLFGNPVNLKILNYLKDCSRLDTQPYEYDYALIRSLDGDCLQGGNYHLNEEQFSDFVKQFQKESVQSENQKLFQWKQLVMNELSIPVRGRGGKREALYVMAYRKLFLDVKNRMLRPEQEVTICKEFTIEGERQSIRKYMDPADYELLEDFQKNKETIKDRVTAFNRLPTGVDDRPYIIALARDIKVDLNKEYGAIMEAFEEGRATYPLRAFFGRLTAKPIRHKEYPLALLEKRANLDQLLAIYNAVKYPVTYVQGPPGTGKSYTIINTIVTAFFNEKTVLLASYNNHPIDSVVQGLKTIPYKKGIHIPFPVVRLGNQELTKKALREIRRQYESIQNQKVFEGTLERNREEKIERTRRLTELLKKYEETLSLREKKAAIETLLNTTKQLTFQADLQGRQLQEIQRKLKQIGEITNEQALDLLDGDIQEFKKYLNFTSIRYLKRLGEPKNEDLRTILYMENEDDRVKAFNRYLSEGKNVRKFLRIFPVVATSCISSHKIGSPKPYFDITIMDEASQCNMAMSLLPVIRGENLMLVGDPQQLNPVILLDEKSNAVLRQKYQIPQEYDYVGNSIYKAFLANDSVSEEILLRHHYRCCKSIIEFNNQKYYNRKLCIESKGQSGQPLVYVDVLHNETSYKNTAPREAEEIVKYVLHNRKQKIGIITPFANQKECINEMLEQNGIKDVACGTVHAFQGDEKDVILFSTALTDQLSERTYHWLKNNRELINVATSRARDKLVVFSSTANLKRLHREEEGRDDMYELAEYVRTNGTSTITADQVHSRALGIKPYSTQTEETFLVSLNHALENILGTDKRCVIRKEVSIAQVFRENISHEGLFYNGRFDFVIYKREYGGKELPVLAVELDGKEHQEEELVKMRDQQKNSICRAHGFELIRVENSYARRYYYIKEILEEYFRRRR